MAADARTDLAPSRGLSLSAVRVTPVQALVLVVAASAIARTLAGWLRATPIYFPDEYIYSEVGRSIAEHGRPLVRGGSAHFPALLQPLLTAPAWLFEDVGTSYRTIQLVNAVVMSLGAVAVFWLARRLGLSQWVAVAIAAFSLAIPDMLYASWILADPFAFPLVLAAVAAATTALDRPTKRAQFAFVAFAGLATFARVQFVVLPVCFVVAMMVVGLRERRLKQALQEQKLVLGLLCLGLVPVFLAGPRSVLGYYDSVVGLDLSPFPILRWMGADGMLLLYSSGWVLVPGALMGLALAVWRPRSRAELGFAVFGSLVALAIVFEAALYAANGADRIQERYFFAILPLIGLLFALYVKRGFPHRVPHALIAGAALAVSARVPLAGFSAADGKSNSPLLLAVGFLEQKIEAVGTASLLVAIVVAGLSVIAAVSGFFPRIAMPLLIGLAIAGSCVASYGAVSFGHQAASNVYDTTLWPDPSYVDHAELGNVALLAAPSNDRGFTTEQLFWNRSIDRLLVLPDASPPDAFAFEQTTIGDDGRILIDGKTYTGPLLVDSFGATAELRGAEQVSRTRIYRLWKPEGTPRLSLYVVNRFYDGWLGLTGSIKLWPDEGEKLAGRLELALSLPRDLPETEMRLNLPDGTRKKVDVKAGEVVPVSMPVCSSEPWSASYEGPVTTNFGERLVTVRMTKPIYTPDPSAC